MYEHVRRFSSPLCMISLKKLWMWDLIALFPLLFPWRTLALFYFLFFPNNKATVVNIIRPCSSDHNSQCHWQCFGNGDFLLASRQMRNANMVSLAVCLFVFSLTVKMVSLLYTHLHNGSSLFSFFSLLLLDLRFPLELGPIMANMPNLWLTVFLPMRSACSIHIFSALPGR